MTEARSARGPTAGWPASSWRFDRSIILSDLALLATASSVVGLFAISPETLEAQGIAYMTSGGGALSKVHPSTLLALIALVLRCLAGRRPLRTAWTLATGDAGVVLMLGACAIASFYAVKVSHTPMTPLIDTFVLPVLMVLLLRGINPAILRGLALVVGLVFCANAVIAILEVLRHWHLVSIPVPAGATSDPRRGDATFDWRAQLAEDWRATALFGHPLSNGLATGALIICSVARGTDWIAPAVKVPVVLLQAAAMFAFGARSALVLTGVATVLLIVKRSLAALSAGQRLSPRRLAIVLCLLFVAIGLGTALVDSGFANQTLERFQDDQGSATTRVTMFNLFAPLSWSSIMLGPDPEQVATLQRLDGLEFGIESSWIGLALTYGAIVTAILLTGMGAFTWSVLKASGPGGGAVILYFYILASVAATMSTKTTIFAMTIVLILIFLQRDDSRRASRPAASAGWA